MAAVDGCLGRWHAECDRLRDRGAFASTGVMGAYRYILPTAAVREAVASMYAEIAHRLGWLELDRTLSEPEFQRLSADVDGWVSQDRTLPELIDTFGHPSVWIGSTGAEHAKTVAYTTTDPDSPLISFHLGKDVRPAVVVLAVRHRRGDFMDAFSFTPAGMRRKPTREQLSLRGTNVWLFHGEGARFASGVFTTMAAGLDWAAEHRVTGILTEYAIGGAYDLAIEEGRFRPSKAHHGTPHHVAGFGPGLEHVHLTEGRRD
ncbi:DUF7710 domain-containing protein [Actinoplanes regularis]|uniref:DUF7710 domain-containing protein n=1 Tax=Actinoplanes regularis TaxID=52697 RepID=UPI00255684FC|nr:hypothetical protein [Actinoplanes regularis]